MLCINPPSFSLNSQHLDNLLQQLPSWYIILSDFNGHNILRGGQNCDSRGELIENFITKNDVCVMNDKSYICTLMLGLHYVPGSHGSHRSQKRSSP